MDQGEGKADGQTGESLGRPDLRLHDLRHSGAVLAALTGATLAADGLPGSLHPGGSDALSARRQGARQDHRGGALQAGPGLVALRAKLLTTGHSPQPQL